MTQRIRDLLDEAVSDLEPQAVDPVAAVVRRGQAGRLKTVGVAALAVAVVLTGGVVLSGRLIGGAPLEPAVPAAEPPTPRVVDGKIVAGSLTLPVPPGWRVLEAGSAPCGMLPDTVLIAGPDDAGCGLAPIELSGIRHTTPGGILRRPSTPHDHNAIVSTPQTVTLSGGEPAWLAYPTTAEINNMERNDPYSYLNTLILPWSKVQVFLRVNGAEQRQIINSIRTAPNPATRLVLPKTAGVAELTIWVGFLQDRAPQTPQDEYGRSTDSKTIEAVLRLMRDQSTVIDDGCSSEGKPTARLTFRAKAVEDGGPKPSAVPTDAVRVLGLPTSDTTTVIITLADDCREAVSSDGGQVRLSGATVDELKRLFGIRTR